MGYRIGIIHLSLAVIDDFHVGRYALIAVNRHSVHLNPNDGQVGRSEFHTRVIGREIVGLAVAGRNHHQHYRQENHPFHNHATFLINWSISYQ